MTAAARIAALSRLADLAQASGDVEVTEIGETIRARLAGEVDSLDRALGLIRKGQWSQATRADYDARNSALARLHQTFSKSADEIETDLARFAAGRWRHMRDLADCPASIAGTADAELWRVLRAVPRPLSAKQIVRILGQKVAPFDCPKN